MEIRKLITIWQGINCRSRKQRESFILRNLRWIRINWRIRRNSFLPFPWLELIFFSYFPIRHPRHGQVDHLLPNVVLFGWLLCQSHRSFGGSSNYTGGLWLWLLEQGVGKVVIHEEDQQNEDNLKKTTITVMPVFYRRNFLINQSAIGSKGSPHSSLHWRDTHHHRLNYNSWVCM